jgi:uncharacterized membrane protein
MIIYSLVAMLCFAVRCILAKPACNVLGTAIYIEINFLVEFGLGLLMLVLNAAGIITLHFEMSRTIMLATASCFQLVAEFFLFLGIAIGIVGCVVAVVSSNFVYVCIVSALMGNQNLNAVQILGATASLLGVLTVTAGDLVI